MLSRGLSRQFNTEFQRSQSRDCVAPSASDLGMPSRFDFECYVMDPEVVSAPCQLCGPFKSFIADWWPRRDGQRIRPCSHKSGWRAACSTSAFPLSDHPADMPERSELSHCVEKVRVSTRSNLFSAAGAFLGRGCEGARHPRPTQRRPF